MLAIDDSSCSWLSNTIGTAELLDGLTALGTELFHWTSPNWISIGSVGNCTVECIDTGSWGIDDGIRRFDEDCINVFVWLLPKLNDCVGPSTNSYSSIDGKIICGISSLDCLDGKDVSLGIGWDEMIFVFDDGTDLLVGFVRAE